MHSKYFNMQTNRFLHGFTFMVIFVFISLSLDAQQTEEPKLSREEMQLQRAQQSVQRAEASLARAQAYLDEADSLKNAGTRMITEAKEDLKVAKDEKATLGKNNSNSLKALEKQANNKDKATADKAKKEMRDLTASHREELRLADEKIKTANTKYDNGQKNITKAKEKEKVGNEKLKPAQKAVAEAEKKLEAITGASDKETDDAKLEEDLNKKDKKKK